MSQNAEQSNTGGHQEIISETTIFAEPVAHIGSFTITNSLLNSWLVVFIIIVLALVTKSKVNIIPQGIQNVWEMVIEGFLGIFDSVTGSREKSLKFFPLVFSNATYRGCVAAE